MRSAPPTSHTLSLHDALPISWAEETTLCICRDCFRDGFAGRLFLPWFVWRRNRRPAKPSRKRSEEHTSELQSRGHLVCRLLLEKKNQEDSLARFYTTAACTYD